MLVPLPAQDPDHGALPVLYAAVADVPGNSFAGPSHLAHMRGAPALIDRSDAANNPELADRLWAVSEELTGIRSPIRPKFRGNRFLERCSGAAGKG